MANANDEEIIEKRPSHPIATACLVLAAIGLVGAIVFQVLEISEVRSGLVNAVKSKPNPHKSILEENSKAFKKACQDVEATNDYPKLVPGSSGEKGAPASTGDAKVDEKTEEPAEKADAKAEEKTEEAPAETKDAKAEEKTEEAPAETKDAKVEEKTEEAPAEETKDAKAEEKAEEPAAEEKAEAKDEKTE
jgi:hypothetical protein